MSKKNTLTKKQLIGSIAEKTGVPPTKVREVIQSFLDQMTFSLSEGNRLEFRDFGVFDVVTRRKKIGRNPRNPDVPIEIPSRKTVKFTPGKRMKELIALSQQVQEAESVR